MRRNKTAHRTSYNVASAFAAGAGLSMLIVAVEEMTVPFYWASGILLLGLALIAYFGKLLPGVDEMWQK